MSSLELLHSRKIINSILFMRPIKSCGILKYIDRRETKGLTFTIKCEHNTVLSRIVHSRN